MEALVPATREVDRHCQLVFSLSHQQAPMKWAQAFAFGDDPSCASLGPQRLLALAQVSCYLSRRSPETSPLDRAGPQSSCLEDGVGRWHQSQHVGTSSLPVGLQRAGTCTNASSYAVILAGGHSGGEPGLWARLPAEARGHHLFWCETLWASVASPVKWASNGLSDHLAGISPLYLHHLPELDRLPSAWFSCNPDFQRGVGG